MHVLRLRDVGLWFGGGESDLFQRPYAATQK